MKKIKLISLIVALALTLTMPVHASSSSDLEVSLAFHYYPDIYTAQFINSVKTNLMLPTIEKISILLHVYNNETEKVVCSYQRDEERPNKYEYNVSWSGSNELPLGEYTDIGVGKLYFKEELNRDIIIEHRERIFYHDGTGKSVGGYALINHDKFLDRGIEIASKFQNIPDDYLIYSEQQMINLLGIDKYFFSLTPQLRLCFGDTIPVYFLDPDRNTLIAVKRDEESNDYMFIFQKDAGDNWVLCGDALMSGAESQPNSSTGTETNYANHSPEIRWAVPANYVHINNNDIQSYLGSVQEFLSIRYQYDGGIALAYYLSPNQDELIVVKSNQAGKVYYFTFTKDSNEHWVLS